MPSSRTRTIGPFNTGGWRNKSGFYQDLGNHLDEVTTMWDTVGFYNQDNAMNRHHTYYHGAFTGDNMASGIAHRSCGNYISNRPTVGHLFTGFENGQALATEAAARSNPSRAHVSLPNILFELGELPLLIQNRGRSVFAAAGSENLKWQFGIRPLLGDVTRLIGFGNAAEKRRNELIALESGGLKRRVDLGTERAEAGGSFVLESYMFFANSSYETVTERKRWAVVKWRPSVPNYSGTNPSQNPRAMAQMMLGLSTSQIPQALWDALPWSWLADWMSSTGSYIGAMNNSIAFLASAINVMVQTTTTRTDTITGVPDWCGGDTTWTSGKESKERFLNTPGLVASVPFLSGGQLSILGSLAALR